MTLPYWILMASFLNAQGVQSVELAPHPYVSSEACTQAAETASALATRRQILVCSKVTERRVLSSVVGQWK
jgi:hypothetical protein